MQTDVDALLIGGGIMSATLATLLQEVEPNWDIQVIERLDKVAEESSDPWNNAGTGHSALCELNYTPQKSDGSVDIAKAVTVNEQFQVTRQFWAHLVESGRLPSPQAFIQPTPHMSFVWGADNVEYLRRRHAALSAHPLFAGMEFSDDPEVIGRWAPLLVADRDPNQPIAATYSAAGSDVDFGRLTELLLDAFTERSGNLVLGTEALDLRKLPDGRWAVLVRNRASGEKAVIRARFVFVGAGGYSLRLLQKAGIDEIRGYGGFPVSGEFLRTSRTDVVSRHHAKVYGLAAVGAPPMSVPHLDTRVVEGRTSLMFGPYAGWTPRFLKTGSLTDLFASIKPDNLLPMIKVGLQNLSLVVYLVKQLLSSPKRKFADLREFYADAEPGDWEKVTAGQRVQVIRPDGVLQFGTEVITAADGSIVGLLGASPGASTAAPIMLDVLRDCFADRWPDWQQTLFKAMPHSAEELIADPELAHAVLTSTAEVLGLVPPVAKEPPTGLGEAERAAGVPV
ncbi:malate dehydrogenase (quinone) [Naumannella halotolerans]|uniref:Probable malate:quinone oxidoreductase n=1 Tax=Naumannella halotolerans TaxID=993414 RepID=A0A4R7JDH8_9ACTN|nr:malate dehydrogenase (quinone) [Naumannella halotolerans]TDT34549.1 malate dehydrogenase (quinone) [Naumannella halotolerans]